MKDLKTYKSKFILLIGGLFILSILSYNLSIKKTIQLAKEKKKLIENLKLAGGAPDKINNLKEKTFELNNLLGSNLTGEEDYHVKILEISSDYSKNSPIFIRNFPEEHKYIENDFLLKTNIITMEGKFIDLLKFLHVMEKQKSIGKIVSSNYYLDKDRYNGNQYLLLTIYIQNITSTDHED